MFSKIHKFCMCILLLLKSNIISVSGLRGALSGALVFMLMLMWMVTNEAVFSAVEYLFSNADIKYCVEMLHNGYIYIKSPYNVPLKGLYLLKFEWLTWHFANFVDSYAGKYSIEIVPGGISLHIQVQPYIIFIGVDELMLEVDAVANRVANTWIETYNLCPESKRDFVVGMFKRDIEFKRMVFKYLINSYLKQYT